MKKCLFALALLAALATPVLQAQSTTAPPTPAQAAQQSAAGQPAAQNAPAEPAAPKAIALDDILAWKGLGAAVISDDGQWIAYRVSPLQGDSDVIVRSTSSDKEYKIEVGEGGFAAASFSDDSMYAAVTTAPTRKAAQTARRARRPLQNGVTIIKLADGTKTEVAKIRRFAFSNETPGWIALHRYGADAAPGGGGTPVAAPPGGRAGGPGDSAPSNRPTGTDLILRDLKTGDELSLGNVSDFQFDKTGRWLAYTIDAADQAGNGVQLRDMTTGAVRVLDSGKFWYTRPSWTEKGDGLAVLKAKEDRAYRDRLLSVVGFTGFGASAAPKKVVYDPSTDKSFPSGMTISPNRSPMWTDDLDALVFGIHEPRKSDRPARPESTDAPGEPPAPPATPPAPAADENADEKPNLVIWHWKDDRLQSAQRVQETFDRNYSYASIYYPAAQKFIRLADDELRTVNIAPKQKYAVGYDVRDYQRMGNLDGRQFRDVYVINLTTGERKLALRKNRWIYGPSPDGTKVLFYQDKHFHVLDLTNGQTRNLTAGVPANFVNVEDDHNIVDPPRNPWGFSSDSTSVVLSDGWDVWQVPVAAGANAVNLTVNGTKDQIRYRGRFVLDPEERGVDLSKPVYLNVYGEWTKKNGIGRLDPGRPGVKNLTWEDASFGRLMKAKNADVVVYSKETRADSPNFYASTLAFGAAKKISDVYPDQKNFNWSGDAMLLDYTSDKGRKLQGSLFLPANYEKGKQYPMIVYIYERLTQGHNTYARPTANGFNRSVYTSNGYAVLMPDITYHVNDPGMSAVWSVVPAVKAAIATGAIDAKKIGLHGHSWGGYQTSFLVTQTDIFAAAIAGAPLTNMISMYSLIYKNTGGTNGAIFESSQGRFTSGYSDNWEAYARNSPVYHAQNVKTPLMILHNDQDGAVDFTQGIEYFNTLRRMDKPVILLEYPGENHGLARPANQQDYTVRMKEWFDHYLKGEPAPDWMKDGIPRLEMEKHINERLKARKKTDPAKTTPPQGGGKG